MHYMHSSRIDTFMDCHYLTRRDLAARRGCVTACMFPCICAARAEAGHWRPPSLTKRELPPPFLVTKERW